MGSLLADNKKNGQVSITQYTGLPGKQTLAGIDHLLLVLPAKIPAAVWGKIPQGSKVQALMRRKAPGKLPAISTRVNNKRQTALHVGTMDAHASVFEALTFGRKMVAAALSEKAGTIGIWVLGFVVNVLGNVIPGIGLIGLVDAVMIFSESRKCLHDHIAKTIVIEVTTRRRA